MVLWGCLALVNEPARPPTGCLLVLVLSWSHVPGFTCLLRPALKPRGGHKLLSINDEMVVSGRNYWQWD